MKKQTLLNLVLSTTIVILLFYIRTSADKPLEYPSFDMQFPGVTECRFNAIGGYADSRVIGKTQAGNAATEFATFAARQGQTITGGILSKAVIDSIFCTGNFNGLAYQLGMDATGSVAPANNIFLIVGGVNVTDGNGGIKINSQSEYLYVPNTWCPPGCLSFE